MVMIEWNEIDRWCGNLKIVFISLIILFVLAVVFVISGIALHKNNLKKDKYDLLKFFEKCKINLIITITNLCYYLKKIVILFLRRLFDQRCCFLNLHWLEYYCYRNCCCRLHIDLSVD